MNSELISFILTILSGLPAPAARPEPMTPAIYASWQTEQRIQYHCPDPDSLISPMGQPAVIGASRQDADGTTISMAMPVLLLPKDQLCAKQVTITHADLFLDAAAAERFRTQACDGDCRHWMTRPATDREVIDYALTSRHWKIFHYDGSDSLRFPKGVFEIYPTNDLAMEQPIAQGASELEAVANALQRG